MKKRTISFLLALGMVLGLCLPVSAAEALPEEDLAAVANAGDVEEEETLSSSSVDAKLASATYTSPFTNLTYTVPSNCEIYNGVDISSHQSQVDWAAVAKAGVDFAIIRCGYRGYGTGSLVRDNYALRNIQQALDNGIRVGVYVYSQATSAEEAAEEAQLLLDIVKDLDVTLPLVYDLEFADSPSGSGFTGRLWEYYQEEGVEGMNTLVEAFYKTVIDAGYTPMLYGSRTFLRDQVNTSLFDEDNPIWLAHYTQSTNYTGNYSFWQYSNQGTVDGVNGNVDCNFCFDDRWFTDEESNLSIEPWNYPAGILAPATFNLSGMISSNYKITSVTGELIAESGTVVQTATEEPNTLYFSILNSDINYKLSFRTLEDGFYRLRYTARDASGNTETWTSELFTIKAKLDPSTLTISPDHVPTGNRTASAFNLTGTVSSNYLLSTVTGVIRKADGTTVLSVTDFPQGSTLSIAQSDINYALPFSQLEPGYYYLEYTAEDSSGATASWTGEVFAIAPTTLFTDVRDSSAWYYSAVYSLASKGIISGFPSETGAYFAPEDSITRAQVVTLLYEMEGAPSTDGLQNPFTDATASWYQNPLKWAYANGIISGRDAVTFDPDSPVTRQELALILYGYAQGEANDVADLSGYLDVAELAPWAATGVGWCVKHGVISSISTEELVLSPTGTATRAQAASMLQRAFFKG